MEVKNKRKEETYVMTLKDFIRDNPTRKLILLWFENENDEEPHTDYNYPNQFTDQAKSMMDMEVMETETYDEEDWIEVWLK